ncbi:multidrug ABC transporter substrate-binding protein [Halobellus salinus]|uniref:Multidrug ABC transporter substrate-binding protein n=1 Tax=Halobellus salinus TaxID=931585 RepID=A0A830EI31_9EURY|nr:ABC transporter permease [Halobellus salinus]GGJ12626.1 multidrug ABC transporter substrate-binding protein [Halobellus salinus]SMP28831.1 putative ABC transport system permease protein [Halobellus salinus]
MDPREALRIAARSIRAHRLRSGLTVVGMVIGIASVVAFATFGASVQAAVIGDIGDTNANNIFVAPASVDDDSPGGEELAATRPVFTGIDVDRIRDQPEVTAVIPQGLVGLSSVTYGNQTVAQQQATATVPATFTDSNTVAGRGFESGADEAVLNEAAARSFDENVTVGSTLRLALASGETRNVTVVGIVSGTRGGFLSGFGDDTPRIFLPVDPFYATVIASPSVGADIRVYPQLTVVAAPDAVPGVKDRTEAYLTTDSDAAQLLADGTEIRVQTSEDIVGAIQDVISQITRFVTGIAVISLVVAAIGIANITLVSVTERTKEIGIMKAVGATNRDTMQLFLTESVLLGTTGAVLGVPVGLAVAWGATRFADVALTLAVDWMIFAVVVGVGVGIVAGLYPAWRASRVDPIDALRYE